jgi:hypothetical protein
MFRYQRYQEFLNDSTFYSKQIKTRGKKQINQYALRALGSIPEEVKRSLTVVERTWEVSTKLYKLADEIYGDPDLWWLIGYYNNKPIDANWSPGDTVLIPTNTRLLLELLEVI